VELKLLAALQAVLELEPMSSSPQLDPAEVGLDNQPKEIEKAFKRLLSQQGVVGVMCFTLQGATVRTTLTPEETASYARVLTPFLNQAKSVSTIVNPKEDLVLLRLTTRKNELIIVPG